MRSPAKPPTSPPTSPPAAAAVPPPSAAPKTTPAKKSRLKRNLIVGTVALLVLGLLVWAFVPKALTVEVAAVTQGRFERAVQEYGKTRVRDRYTVSAPLAGRVGRVLLKQGDSVAQGDTVALLWPLAPALLDARAEAGGRHPGDCLPGQQTQGPGEGQDAVTFLQVSTDP